MPFVKLDTRILDSTLWLDAPASRVFITALLMAEPWDLTEPMEQLEVRTLAKTGFVVPPGWYGWIAAAGIGIIRRSMLSDAEGYAALEALGSADCESRSPDFDGRRLVRVDGGYIVLNYMKYRERDYTSAERSKRYRERKTALIPQSVTSLHRGVTPSHRDITQAEAEADADAEGTHIQERVVERERVSTAGAADRHLPFFANVVLSPEESKAKWSARRYKNFWNRHVSHEARLTTMSQKWVHAIHDFRERRGLTPVKFLAALQEMEQKKPIQSGRDFYDAMNSVVANVGSE
jgi:hypothetical protein